MQLRIKPLKDTSEIEIHVSFRLPRSQGADKFSFDQIEEALAQELNDIGQQTTEHLLETYDSEGEVLQCEKGRNWSSKGRGKHVIETPYGAVSVLCHVYQTSAGGRVRVPLCERAKLIGSATPRMAKMTAAKLAEMSCGAVARDFAENHLRPVSKSAVQALGTAVAALATTYEGELEKWQPQSEPREVALITVGVDGAHLNTRRDGWRQSMAGTLALHDADGERLETLYAGGGPGESPPEGKSKFFERMDLLLERVRQRYPQARVTGLSDGAVDLQNYLAGRCEEHLLDFHHAAEYLSAASIAFSAGGKAEDAESKTWAEIQRAILRDKPGGALEVLGAISRRLEGKEEAADPGAAALPKLKKAQRAELERVKTYWLNHITVMDYAGWQQRNQPIGSGVTEAACKVLIKQRMCQSGMRWSIGAADALVSLRALYLTPSRWQHFWLQYSKTHLSSL